MPNTAPKRAAPKKAPPPPAQTPRRTNNPPRVQSQELLFPEIGLEKYHFIQAARAFDNALKAEYGDQMTITRFEKILLEIQGRSELRPRLRLTDEMMALRHAYVEANRRRMEEALAFRQSLSLTPVVANLDATRVDDLFPKSKEKKEEK